MEGTRKPDFSNVQSGGSSTARPAPDAAPPKVETYTVLKGDSLSKITARRTNVVEGVGDREVRKGTNGKVVELHRIPNEHSDGMLAVYLPAEKVLWSADITVVNPNPAQLGVVRSAVEAINRLKLDFTMWIPAHPPNPDRPLTRADVMAAAGTQ